MSFGSFLQGLAGGVSTGNELNNRRETRDLRRRAMISAALGRDDQVPGGDYVGVSDEDGYYPGAASGWARRASEERGSSGGGGGGPEHIATDPVATDLPRHARAFLNATALGESAGAYDVRYTPNGGRRFALNGQHPRIFEPGPEGPSSAAGRYQFTATTWDRMGGGEFTPYRQDHQAWVLAQQDYRARTGRDLNRDLIRNGLTGDVTRALAPTWAAFRGRPGRFINAYNDSYRRYTEQARSENQDPYLTQPEAPGGVQVSSAGGMAAPDGSAVPSDAPTNKLPTLAETGGRGVINSMPGDEIGRLMAQMFYRQDDE